MHVSQSPLVQWTFVFFFFSSRRRHTRLQGDWSSDVCSSDLPTPSSSTVCPGLTWPLRTPWSSASGIEAAEVLPCWSKIGRAQRLNSSHLVISYAVFCLKKKKII